MNGKTKKKEWKEKQNKTKSISTETDEEGTTAKGQKGGVEHERDQQEH